MSDYEMLKGACANGAARVRKLANEVTIIHIADKHLTVFALNVSGKIVISPRCKRMSRGYCHRLVARMTDATDELKQTYHSLIDAGREASK